jgi:hypothetical protein
MNGRSRRLSECDCEHVRILLLMIRSSRLAAKKAHPDKGGSEAKMAAVNEAYEVLSKPGKFAFQLSFFSPPQPPSMLSRASPALR